MIFFCFNCTSRKLLNNPININYSSKIMSAKIELQSVKKIKRSNKKNDWSYFYYGSFESQLINVKELKEIRLKYKGKESPIYLDSFGDFNFWYGDWWNSKGFRKNKIYIVFDEPNIDWNLVKVIEVEIPKPMSTKEVCDLLKRISSPNYSDQCGN